MRALVHIGPPKTGTTSIQAFLRRNRQQLKNNHIACFANADWVRTVSAAFKVKPPTTAWYQAQSRSSGNTFEEFKQQSISKLRAELRKLPSSTKLLVISSEGFFCYRLEEIRALHRFLAEFCDQVEIITYLRRQDLAAISRQKNKIRNGSEVAPIVVRHHGNLDYWPQLQKWSEVFGQEQIRVRRFPDSAPTKFDLIEHFQSELTERVGDCLGHFEKPEYRNVGWNWQASEYMRIANRVCQLQMVDVTFHRRLVRQIDRQFSSGEKPTITRGLAKELVALYQASNEQVLQTFLPGESSLFHDDFSRYPENETLLGQQLSAEEAIKLSVELMFGLSHNKVESKGSQYQFRNNRWHGFLKNISRGIIVRLRRFCGI